MSTPLFTLFFWLHPQVSMTTSRPLMPSTVKTYHQFNQVITLKILLHQQRRYIYLITLHKIYTYNYEIHSHTDSLIKLKCILSGIQGKTFGTMTTVTLERCSEKGFFELGAGRGALAGLNTYNHIPLLSRNHKTEDAEISRITT